MSEQNVLQSLIMEATSEFDWQYVKDRIKNYPDEVKGLNFLESFTSKMHQVNVPNDVFYEIKRLQQPSKFFYADVRPHLLEGWFDIYMNIQPMTEHDAKVFCSSAISNGLLKLPFEMFQYFPSISFCRKVVSSAITSMESAAGEEVDFVRNPSHKFILNLLEIGIRTKIERNRNLSGRSFRKRSASSISSYLSVHGFETCRVASLAFLQILMSRKYCFIFQEVEQIQKLALIKLMRNHNDYSLLPALVRICPKILKVKVNDYGDTWLHIAAEMKEERLLAALIGIHSKARDKALYPIGLLLNLNSLNHTVITSLFMFSSSENNESLEPTKMKMLLDCCILLFNHFGFPFVHYFLSSWILNGSKKYEFKKDGQYHYSILVRHMRDILKIMDIELDVLSATPTAVANTMSCISQRMQTHTQNRLLLEESEFYSFLLDESNGGSRLLQSKSRSTKRLLIHKACSYGLGWSDGLKVIIQKNTSALNTLDPITNLFPLALLAHSERSILSTLYELVRFHPSAIKGGEI